ncbi:hypothetical protein ACFYXH_36835 [Streptomyces sp. NPDC002730]|uniref:hypothetical protein n=1 Tax=Streptomyces sp. NPDC002730 TaxID=3364662 RepID=UPI0036D115BB
MPTRKHTAVTIAAAAAVLTLTSCGKSADDVFSNLNGTNSSSSHDTSTSGPDAPRSDAPPNYADNNRVRQPGEMSLQDEKRAGQKATEVGRALDDLRRRGRISPAEVRPALAQLAAPAHLSVEALVIGTGMDKAEGSTYGIWIGKTACVTGAVSKDRVWADANGHYPETGCMPPASTH